MEQWSDVYTEIADKITVNLEDIRWVDLWHEQVSYLTSELPFPVPAIFISFKTLDMIDMSLLEQQCNTQIDFYLFYETFSDTYNGSYNKNSAIDYLKTLTRIHQLFHGKDGDNYSTMRRVDMGREESGGAGNLYRISFTCLIEDSSAMVVFNEANINDINITNETINRPVIESDEQKFILP